MEWKLRKRKMFIIIGVLLVLIGMILIFPCKK